MLAMDHIVIAVTDLDQAIRDYQTLGFTVTPGGEHAGGVSHNALIIFADDTYIELIAFKAEVPGWRWQDVHARAGEGLVDYALVPSDIEETLEAARRGGYWEGPIDGGRARPDGKTVSWRIGRPATSDLPFLCADVTPRHFRVPTSDFAFHENGATGIASVAVAVSDLTATMARFDALVHRSRAAAAAEPAPDPSIAVRLLGSTDIVFAQPTSPTSAFAEHLRLRGEGPAAIRLRGPATGFDRALTHGVELAISP